MLLGDGCSFEYDLTSVAIANYYMEIDWDVEQCQNGTWVAVDTGADAYPCSSCSVETRNIWSDTCGNATARTQVCP